VIGSGVEIQQGSRPDDGAVVAIASVAVTLGGEVALRPTSFMIGCGEAVVVQGSSGSGKSTLLRAIAGLVEPSTGMVELWSGARGLKGRRIGITLEEPRLWPWMRALDNVVCLAGLNGVAISREAATSLLGDLRLADAAHVRASKLSQGMRRRVQLAGALAVGHDLLLLDEPTASLDDDLGQVVWKCLERRRADGVTLVVASHDDSWQGQLAADSIELDAG
jgi:ABC-type multidrug transport system ATPase subunit